MERRIFFIPDDSKTGSSSSDLKSIKLELEEIKVFYDVPASTIDLSKLGEREEELFNLHKESESKGIGTITFRENLFDAYTLASDLAREYNNDFRGLDKGDFATIVKNLVKILEMTIG